MRKFLMTAAFAALVPGMASAMPLAPALPQAPGLIQVQQLPGYYRWDPCMPGAPPVRARIFDPGTDSMVETYIPASRYCRGGGRVYSEPPRRRWEDERPVYRERPRYYDDEPVYRPRRPPPPGWERDPYTGRDMRILR